MANTKQTRRRAPPCAKAKARLELKAEASKQIETWQQANQEAAPTQDGLLARLRARLFGPRRPSAQQDAQPFDILAELPHDLRIIIFKEATASDGLARLALTSKPWGMLVARNLPLAFPLPERLPLRRGTLSKSKTLLQTLEAVASRMHPVEICVLAREMQETLSFYSLGDEVGYAVAHCNPLHRGDWTAELLLATLRPFLVISVDTRELLADFAGPLIASGHFKETEKLIKIVRGAYCPRTKDQFNFMVDFHVAHLQEHEGEGMVHAWQLEVLDREADLPEDVVTFQTAEWEEAMSQLGTLVGKESPRLPMQSVLYILQRALEGGWRAAAAAGVGNGDPAEARMKQRVASFFRSWAPAVDFPASWPAEDVEAWFAPWCDAQLSVHMSTVHDEFHGDAYW